ncbi:MAG: MbcA/ParS/Xre antitoxin family protein [Bryobacter sp.]|nr:MbcA/ParS/Xre antitoxin family protein [Bryobacter sp.]
MGATLQRVPEFGVLRAALPIVAHAFAVFGDEEKAKHWLTTPLELFGDREPIDLLATEEGREQVENVLIRIEHNIHS